MKRNHLLTRLSLLLILTALLTVCASAATVEGNRNTHPNVDRKYITAMREAIEDGVTDVTDDKYGLTGSNYSQILTYLMYSDPMTVGVNDLCMTYILGNNGSIAIKGLDLCYVENYDAYRAAFRDRLPQMMAEVKALLPENATDFQKILVSHDYLVATTAYAKDAVSKESSGTEKPKEHWYIYDASGPVVNHSAVCKGYSLAYKYIMDQFGIPCLVATSANANHAWNIVKLDGEWYHIDLTADDPARDMLGRVSHGMFLVTNDYVLQDQTKQDYVVCSEDFDFVLTDDDFTTTAYQNDIPLWKSANSVVHFYNGHTYAIQGNYLKKDNEDVEFLGIWHPADFPAANFTQPIAKLSGFGKYLYVTTPKAVIKYDLDTMVRTELFQPELSDGYSIFGLARIEGKLYCTVNGNLPTAAEQWIYIPGEDVTYTVPDEPGTPVVPDEPDEPDPPAVSYEREETVTLPVDGQTILTDDRGDYSDSVNTLWLDSSIAGVNVRGEETPGTPAVPASVSKMTTFTPGIYRIGYQSGSTTYYMVVSGSSLSCTTDVEEATLFTVSGTASSLTILSGNCYLSHSTSSVSLSTSTSNAAWQYDGSRFYFSKSTQSWFSSKTTKYYLRYANGFTVSTSTSGTASAFSYVEAIPAVPGENYTKIAITGNAVGETRVVVGDTLYIITVTPAVSFVKDTDGIDSGAEYVIACNGNALAVANGNLTSAAIPETSNGLDDVADNAVWIITKSGSTYTLKNKATGQYLTVATSGSVFRRTYTLSLSSSGTAWSASASGETMRFSKSSRYLSYSGGFTLTTSKTSNTDMTLYQNAE